MTKIQQNEEEESWLSLNLHTNQHDTDRLKLMLNLHTESHDESNESSSSFTTHEHWRSLHYKPSELIRQTAMRSLFTTTAFLFDAIITIVVVANTIDHHQAPHTLKMEQLLVAVSLLFVVTRARDFFEQRFDKVLCSLEDVINSAQ